MGIFNHNLSFENTFQDRMFGAKNRGNIPTDLYFKTSSSDRSTIWNDYKCKNQIVREITRNTFH